MSKSKVSVTVAAKMAGVSRATFYRHIEEKPISTHKDDNGNTVIDVAELIRVYGDKLKTLEDAEKASKNKNETSQDSDTTLELAVLREKITSQTTERERERQQLTDQIEDLRARLERAEEQRVKSEEQKDRLTLMLTDQRSEKEKIQEKDKLQSERLEALHATIESLKQQQDKILQEQAHHKKGLIGRLFSSKQSA